MISQGLTENAGMDDVVLSKCKSGKAGVGNEGPKCKEKNVRPT